VLFHGSGRRLNPIREALDDPVSVEPSYEDLNVDDILGDEAGDRGRAHVIYREGEITERGGEADESVRNSAAHLSS
jgi:hypothetical protein